MSTPNDSSNGAQLRSGAMTADPTPRLYGSIAEMREANKAAGQHFFDKDTLRFFDGIVPEDQPIVHGRFFVTSEQFDGRSPRLHTLRYANAEAGINTVGRFQQFASFDEAREALSDAITQGVTVQQVSGESDADPSHYHWQAHIGELPIDCVHTKADAANAAAELKIVLESEVPPNTAGDYEIDDEPTEWICERNVLGKTLHFEWSGGIYIDVSCPPGGAAEVINISAESGGARIERNQEAFEREVDEWIEHYPPESLLHDIESW
jgi:hypothetical protein